MHNELPQPIRRRQTLPQDRQWCRRRQVVKYTQQIIHMWVSRSRTQVGARLPSSLSSNWNHHTERAQQHDAKYSALELTRPGQKSDISCKSLLHQTFWATSFFSLVLLLIFSLFMVALCNRTDHYIFALWFLSIFLFFPRLISVVRNWMSTILLHMVWP